MEDKKYNRLSIYFAFGATLISIASFVISYKSCNISQEQLDLQIEPKISAELNISDTTNINFILHNDGTRKINGIKVAKIKRYVTMGNNFETYNIPENLRFDELDVGDSLIVSIDYNLMRSLLDSSKIKELKINATCEVYIGFYVQYLSKPDNSKYNLSKYVFLWRTENGSFIPADLDSPNYNLFHNVNYKKNFQNSDHYFIK